MANKIQFYRGDTVNINLSLSGTDLTGATIYFTAKSVVDDDATDSAAVIKKDVTSHTDATAGQTTIALTSTDTNSVDPGIYGYDIQLKNSDDAISTLEVGQLKVLGDYTRRTS
jgi:hypothetical protein